MRTVAFCFGVVLGLYIVGAIPPRQAVAADVCLGTIRGLNDGGTPALNNLTMGSSNLNCGGLVTDGGFSLPKGAKVAVQCDVDARVRTGRSSTTAATSSNSVKVEAGKLYDTPLPVTDSVVAVTADSSGTSFVCRVFAVSP